MKPSTQILRHTIRSSLLRKPFPSSAPAAIQTPSTRPFLTQSLPPLTLHASRTLPYAASPLYALIADINSYPSFLPFCASASITSQSSPRNSTRWPRTADLKIGWGGFSETFRSRVYCAPDRILEALAGNAKCSIPASELEHYEGDDERSASGGNGRDIAEKDNNDIFASLLTRWTLKPFPYKPPPPDGSKPQTGNASAPAEDRTQVDLHIEVQWASAIYAALSQAAAPKVAGMVVEAFERRAREVLGNGSGHGK